MPHVAIQPAGPIVEPCTLEKFPIFPNFDPASQFATTWDASGNLLLSNNIRVRQLDIRLSIITCVIRGALRLIRGSNNSAVSIRLEFVFALVLTCSIESIIGFKGINP